MAKRTEVDAWLKRYDNPMKEVVAKIREIILAADPRIEESIKWQAPTFSYRGNLASFFPKSKKHASLMFHRGASIPGRFKRLVGDGKEARSLKIASKAEAIAAKKEIEAIVRAWCDWKDHPNGSTAKKKTTKKKTTKKKTTKKKATKKKATKKKATKKKATKKKATKKKATKKKATKKKATKKKATKKKATKKKAVR